jgi:MoxR-like ATPase
MRILKIFFTTIALVLIISGCLRFSNTQSIRAMDGKLGTNLSETGLLANETDEVPSETQIIFLEFFLDVPDGWEVTLQYKWFHEDTLVLAGASNHTRGHTIATLDYDPEIIQNFPTGGYRVEVWYLNTLLLTKSFYVK